MQPSILVVDDDPDFWALADRLLCKRGYAPVWAADGHQAINLACAHPPKAILLDLGLPEEAGLRVLQRVKSIDKLRRIPVIVVTGQDDARTRNIAEAFGAVAFVPKPIQKEHFLATIDKVLSPGN